MAGGVPFSDTEIMLIAEDFAIGEKVRDTLKRHTAAFPDTPRTEDAIVQQRTKRRTKELIRQVWAAGKVAMLGARVDSSGVPDPDAYEMRRDDDGLTILRPRGHGFDTPADLLTRAKIAFEFDDLGEPVPLQWKITQAGAKGWTTAMKDPDGRAISVPNSHTFVKLEPRKDVAVTKAVERLCERIADARVDVAPPLHPDVSVDDGHLFELSLPDLHFGKLAHAIETGEDMDTSIIRARMMEATDSLIQRAQATYTISESLFIVGNDLLNVDSERGETSAGTRQDIDSRFHKVLDEVMIAMTDVIDRLHAHGPVRVLLVPGNHDREAAQSVARFLAAWYRNMDSVDVDTSPMTRKYHAFGDVLLGFTHGDQEPAKALHNIMADECRDLWGKARIREWHIGHLHKAKEWQFLSMDETRGTRVRHLSSLTGLDAWHAGKGYRSQKQADGFVWHRKRGLRDIVVWQPEEES